MGKVFDGIDEHLRAWIERQALFFVGTAPLSADGHVNVSPKGPIGSLSILGPERVAYLDVVGSGAETIAHLRENGRIVVMLCAFAERPRIVRLYGRGRFVTPRDAGFDALLERCSFDAAPAPAARRAIIDVELERIADSCGYGVPLMAYEGMRPHMDLWADKKLRTSGPEGMLDYQRKNNSSSIDGLPAVEVPARD